MKRIMLTALILLGLLPACSWSRGTIGDEFRPEQVAAIKKGVSTRADVVSALGAPDRIIEVNGQEIFQYYRYDLKAKSLILVIVNFSRLNMKSDDLYVFFTREKVVQDVAFGKRTDRLEFQFWPWGK